MKKCLTPLFLLLYLSIPQNADCRETPVSYGAPARVDTPILRVPMMKTPPEIDGVMSPGEWEDASALSAFWYDFARSDFRYLAPIQTQLQTYVAYDKDHLYFAFSSPTYPLNSWLKARGRFPDVLNHPLYGILWDDHLELELRAHHDLAEGFQLGLLRFDVNPIGTYIDWYWSQQGGMDRKWTSKAKIRCTTDNNRWITEYAIPHKSMAYGAYAGKNQEGKPYVQIPPPDGTIYRTWLVRGIGGNGPFFNAFDNHIWNTCKTQLIFDSKAPSFQVNELGPMMDDIIDLKLTVKNHGRQSKTVLLGFFVESAAGTIYSSYESPELKDGLLELVPGEVKKINLKQPFPGITQEDNVLWFDVRSAGRPAKPLFRTRLIRFHAMDGGAVKETKMVVSPGSTDPKMVVTELPFRERRLEAIAELRPPKKDFDFRWDFSSYTKRVSGVIDRGIHGASEDAKRATEAKLFVMKDNAEEDVVKETTAPFSGNFACFLIDLPGLVNGEQYKLSLLLFDKNKRIVGERSPKPFTYRVEEWQGNTIGLEDLVWEPFTPIEKHDDGFSTLKHRFTLTPAGLPAQIVIKPDIRELPLERRDATGAGTQASRLPLSDGELLELGRGPQLRAPMRLEAVADGKRVTAKVVEPAKLVRQWKSEFEYSSKLKVGPVDVDLTTQYDCDGSMYCRMLYGGPQPAELESLELVMEVDGVVDMMLSETGNGGMACADRWELTLPEREGMVWDSTETEMELFYSRFIPYFWFGNADRGWTWYCDKDREWILDRDGSSMQLERDGEGKVTWRVQFVNHKAQVTGARQIDFAILTHPTKPKPKEFRKAGWHHFAGHSWAAGYAIEPIDLPEPYLIKRWRQAACAPKDWPDEKAAEWRKDDPPFFRYGQWRNVGVCPELDKTWEDKATYYFERHIRVGRRVGWWMDEYFPVCFGSSENLAAGNAYLRDPDAVGEKELPWHRGFLATPMRLHYKRLARVCAKNNVPQRQHTWSNNAAQMLESYIYSSLLVEECGAGHRSYEIDMTTQFPNSLYRYMCKNHTGLVTTLCADYTPATAGDDKRLDRQHLGRCLLNDIGFSPSGPHGIIHHKEQGVRLLSRLTEFGFFEDANTEKLPFWRNEQYVKIGDRPSPESKVYVTVYRRPLDNGKGYKALFVIMNESLEHTELPLTIAYPDRVFGGPNTLTAGDIHSQMPIPNSLGEWWKRISARNADQPALKDLGTGEAILRAEDGAESYGPIHVRYHDFRVLYGHHEEGE